MPPNTHRSPVNEAVLIGAVGVGGFSPAAPPPRPPPLGAPGERVADFISRRKIAALCAAHAGRDRLRL